MPVVLTGGTTLALIRGKDPLVNWGSQFPTRWGQVDTHAARYLDALLRDGRTPWAVEMKVECSGGVGRYYRHALAQAVLYRQFIRQAQPMHFWFDEQQLNASTCRAAVVVPELTQRSWAQRLRRLCFAYDVDLVEVPRAAASLR